MDMSLNTFTYIRQFLQAFELGCDVEIIIKNKNDYLYEIYLPSMSWIIQEEGKNIWLSNKRQ